MGDEIAKKQSTVDKLSARYTKLLQNKPEVVQQHMAPLRVSFLVKYNHILNNRHGQTHQTAFIPSTSDMGDNEV